MDNISIAEVATREAQIHQLFSLTTNVEQKAAAIQVLYPRGRKAKLIEAASKDSKDRPVRYYREMGYDELKHLLTKGEVTAQTDPYLKEKFKSSATGLQHELAAVIQKLPFDIQAAIASDWQQLQKNFTLESFTNFVMTKIPRKELFRMHMHQKTRIGNYYGLLSLSVGGPVCEPVSPAPESGRLGSVVVEMVIPDDEIYVNSLVSKFPTAEYEKEVNTVKIISDWVVDVYVGKEDFTDRCVADPKSVLYRQYQQLLKDRGEFVWVPSHNADMLAEWKKEEKIADLVPRSKLSDIDPQNPVNNAPLLIA